MTARATPVGPPEVAGGETPTDCAFPCSRCGAARMAPGEIRSAFWQGERLIVVRGIPALICSACGEEYVGDEIAVRLDRLRARRDPGTAPAQMIVPVYDFATLPGLGP